MNIITWRVMFVNGVVNERNSSLITGSEWNRSRLAYGPITLSGSFGEIFGGKTAWELP